MPTHSSDQIIDIDAAVITLKIVSSIFCGIATAYLQYLLFGQFVLSFALAPVGCGLLASSFFMPERRVRWRRLCFAALLTFLAISLIIGGLVRIPAHVYYQMFLFLSLVILIGLVGIMLFSVGRIAPETNGDTFGDPGDATRSEDYRSAFGKSSAATSDNSGDAVAFKKTKVTRRLWTYKTRMRIWNEFDRKCYICHQPLKSCAGKYMHLDHRKPISKGGLDTEENLAACCAKCNREKHAHDEPSLYSDNSRQPRG